MTETIIAMLAVVTPLGVACLILLNGGQRKGRTIHWYTCTCGQCSIDRRIS